MADKQYISNKELKILNKVCLDIDSGKKYVNIPKEKQYIRGNLAITKTQCRRCGAEILKNNDKQIVYYCSRDCRNDKSKSKFRFIKEE